MIRASKNETDRNANFYDLATIPFNGGLPQFHFPDSSQLPFTSILPVEDQSTKETMDGYSMIPPNSTETGQSSFAMMSPLQNPINVSVSCFSSTRNNSKQINEVFRCQSKVTESLLGGMMPSVSDFVDDPFETDPIQPTCENTYKNQQTSITCNHTQRSELQPGSLHPNTYTDEILRRNSIRQALDFLLDNPVASFNDVDDGGYDTTSYLTDKHSEKSAKKMRYHDASIMPIFQNQSRNCGDEERSEELCVFENTTCERRMYGTDFDEQNLMSSHVLTSPNLITPFASCSSFGGIIRNGNNDFIASHGNVTDSSLTRMLNVDFNNNLDYESFEPQPIHPTCLEENVELRSNKNSRDSSDSQVAMNSSPSSRTTFRRRSIQQALDLLFDYPGFSIDDIDAGGYVCPSILNDLDSEKMPGEKSDKVSCSEIKEPNSLHSTDGVSKSAENADTVGFCDKITTNSNIPSMKHSVDRLNKIMKKSRRTQDWLQEWDKRNGLPRSHCCTMMHTNRSRKQLEEGRILPKWNGAPLIGNKRLHKEGHQQKRKRYAPRRVKEIEKDN